MKYYRHTKDYNSYFQDKGSWDPSLVKQLHRNALRNERKGWTGTDAQSGLLRGLRVVKNRIVTKSSISWWQRFWAALPFTQAIQKPGLSVLHKKFEEADPKSLDAEHLIMRVQKQMVGASDVDTTPSPVLLEDLAGTDVPDLNENEFYLERPDPDSRDLVLHIGSGDPIPLPYHSKSDGYRLPNGQLILAAVELGLHYKDIEPHENHNFKDWTQKVSEMRKHRLDQFSTDHFGNRHDFWEEARSLSESDKVRLLKDSGLTGDFVTYSTWMLARHAIVNIVQHLWGVDTGFEVLGRRSSPGGQIPRVTIAMISRHVQSFLSPGNAACKTTLGATSKQKIAGAIREGTQSAQVANWRSSWNAWKRDRVAFICTGGFSKSSGHTVNIFLQEINGKTYLAYTNRGEEFRGLIGVQNAMGTDKSADMRIFEVHKPGKINKQLFERLMGPSAHGERSLDEMLHFLESSVGLHRRLRLREVAWVPKSKQASGTCTSANSKGGVHAAFIFAHAAKQATGDPDFTAAIGAGTADFKEWEVYARQQGFSEFIDLGKVLSIGTEDSSLRPREHFRLTAAMLAKVRSDKYATAKASREGDNSVQASLDAVLAAGRAFAADCPYEVQDCLASISSEQAQDILQDCDQEGAFILCDTPEEHYELVVRKPGGVINIIYVKKSEWKEKKLSELLDEHKTATLPYLPASKDQWESSCEEHNLVLSRDLSSCRSLQDVYSGLSMKAAYSILKGAPHYNGIVCKSEGGSYFFLYSIPSEDGSKTTVKHMMLDRNWPPSQLHQRISSKLGNDTTVKIYVPGHISFLRAGEEFARATAVPNNAAQRFLEAYKGPCYRYAQTMGAQDATRLVAQAGKGAFILYRTQRNPDQVWLVRHGDEFHESLSGQELHWTLAELAEKKELRFPVASIDMQRAYKMRVRCDYQEFPDSMFPQLHLLSVATASYNLQTMKRENAEIMLRGSVPKTAIFFQDESNRLALLYTDDRGSIHELRARELATFTADLAQPFSAISTHLGGDLKRLLLSSSSRSKRSALAGESTELKPVAEIKEQDLPATSLGYNIAFMSLPKGYGAYITGPKFRYCNLKGKMVELEGEQLTACKTWADLIALCPGLKGAIYSTAVPPTDDDDGDDE